jgi:membrane protein involved in colicin uptake
MGIASRIWGFLGWQGAVGLVVAAILGTLLFLQHGETRHWQGQATKFEQLYKGEQSAHRQTVINYQNAAEQARKKDVANKARAEAEQKAERERTLREYEARIADARARAERLRQQLNKAGANPGSSGAAGLPGDSAASPGANAASPEGGLSIDERLIATEQAIQLDELIDYVEGILKVDLSGRE